jgi:hypothetical protein
MTVFVALLRRPHIRIVSGAPSPSSSDTADRDLRLSKKAAKEIGQSRNLTVGLWEDPATGMAAVPLGALLVACGVSEFGRIVVEQGTAVGRTSFISVEFGEGTVCISGAGVVTASGCIRVAR